MVRVELVSTYSSIYAVEKTHTEYFKYPVQKLKRKDWGEYIGKDWYENTDLFQCFSELENGTEIVFEVYTIDENNVRNGRAQCLTVDENDEWLLRWDSHFKNSKQHGKHVDYDYDIRTIRRVTRKPCKSFFTNGKYVDAKTVAEWRKRQSDIRAAAQSTLVHKK